MIGQQGTEADFCDQECQQQWCPSITGNVVETWQKKARKCVMSLGSDPDFSNNFIIQGGYLVLFSCILIVPLQLKGSIKDRSPNYTYLFWKICIYRCSVQQRKSKGDLGGERKRVCVSVSGGCRGCKGVWLSATPDVKMTFAICHLNSKLRGIYLSWLEAHKCWKVKKYS